VFYQPLVTALQAPLNEQRTKYHPAGVCRMPVIDKLRRVPLLCDALRNQFRQFYTVVFRVQFSVWEDIIFNPKLAIVLIHLLRPPKCKLFGLCPPIFLAPILSYLGQFYLIFGHRGVAEYSLSILLSENKDKLLSKNRCIIVEIEDLSKT